MGTRLALLTASMSAGGAERAILTLANGFAERGYPVDLVIASAHGPLMADIPDRVRVIDLGARRALTALPKLVGYLKRERPLAMLSAMGHINLIAIWAREWARPGTRLVVSQHDIPGYQVGRSPIRQAKRRAVARLCRRYYRRADLTVAVSHGLARYMAEAGMVPPHRLRVIYNPVVTAEFDRKSRMPLEHPWFEPGEAPVVLAAGRLVPEKDFATLIGALAEVRRRRRARLMILGEGEERAALENLVARSGLAGDVALAGFVANPYPYMRRAALFALCSRFEALPSVLVEALYCGARVISTDCQYGPREILDGGQYGALTPVGDVPALARAIEEGLTERPAPVPARSWKRFEAGAVVDRYLEALLAD